METTLVDSIYLEDRNTETLPKPIRVSVVGLGSWGTAVSGLVASNVIEVIGWDHLAEVVSGVNADHKNPLYATDYELPSNVWATSSLEEAMSSTSAVLLATPSTFLRATSRRLAPYIANDVPVLVLAKGIERETGMLVHEVVADVIGNDERVALLSGPTHSEEVVKGLPTAAVVGARDPSLVEFFRSIVGGPHFRIYGSGDRIGVASCGAVKNVVALACGIASGLGLGDNTLALLMTRGLAEMTRIACALGAEPLTCMGLAGMGDLVATCTSRHSRNRTFGKAFVDGESLPEFEARTSMVVEGYRAAASAHDLAKRLSVDAPVIDALYRVFYENSPLKAEISALLSRVPRTEFYGIDPPTNTRAFF